MNLRRASTSSPICVVNMDSVCRFLVAIEASSELTKTINAMLKTGRFETNSLKNEGRNAKAAALKHLE